jgi:hypothetical protein
MFLKKFHKINFILLLCFLILICFPTSAVFGSTGKSPGRSWFVKRTNPVTDQYTNSPNISQQQWLNNNFDRMMVHSPYFDAKTAWYPNGWLYVNSYAIYNSNLSNTTPNDVLFSQYILRDGSGNKLYIPYECNVSIHECSQFAADISNPNYITFFINNLAAELSKGNYKGIWLDDVDIQVDSKGFINISDGDGNKVMPFDSNTGTTMTASNWIKYFSDFTQAIRAAFPNKEILHNVVWYNGPYGVRDNDPGIIKTIQSADYINIERGVNDSGLTGGLSTSAYSFSYTTLLAYIDHIHSLGRGVIIDGQPGQDGGVADLVKSEYSLASYYLISSGSDGIGDGTVNQPNWWAGYGVDLGTPTGNRYIWNSVLRRDYTKGMVLVNLPSAATVTLTLPSTYNRVDGTATNSVTLAARQGAVLLTPTTSVSIVGDFNNDGFVNSIDLSLMTNAWNQNNFTYDLNHDGIVNSLDYTIMVQNWSK